jgi:MFS family permease
MPVQSTGRSISIGVILLVAFSCFSLFVSAQSESVENHPTSEDPYMYFWGSDNLDNCWNNFENSSETSATEGYGEILFPEGQDVSVEFSCELQSGFSEDFILEINKSISINMKFNIESGNCGGAECDLTLTLLRGEEQIAQLTQSANDVNNGNDFTPDWNVVVDDSIRTWSKDTRTIITISYSVPAETGNLCDSPIPVPGSDCSGSFRMYYSDEGGEPGAVSVEFPIYVSISDREASGDLISMNSTVFFIPFILTLGVLGITVRREGWDLLSSTAASVDIVSTDNLSRTGLFLDNLRAVKEFEIIASWNDGKSLIDNQFRRYVSLSILYFAQGIPAGFTTVTFLAYLSAAGTPPGELAGLLVAISLPWTFKWIWGPVIDMIQFPKYGLRRPWILFAQTGMAISLGGLLFVDDMNSQIELVTKILFVHNLFSSLQDVGVDALAVDILQPDEVAKANGFMFASKRFGIIFSGAILGATLIKYFDIKAVVLVQLPLILLIMALPLFLRERPEDSLFPWQKSPQNKEMEQYVETLDELIENKDWEVDEEYHVASWVGSNLYQKDITVGALLLWLGLTTELFSFGCSILQILLENDTLKIISDLTAILGHILLLGAIFFLIFERTKMAPVLVRNPFFLIPESGRSNFAETGYNITKGFSLRSSLLLIVVCLLSELYVFTSPIVIDIFVNEAGWSITKYSAVMGGIVLGFTIIGQVLGGFLGDRFGVREVAMVGFTLLGLANAFLAILSPFWENTPLMISYLCFQAFVSGVAWICIISVSMRLTYSKAGGSQFTAYMSMFNLSAIIAYSFTEYMVERYEYNAAIYIGAALTLITVLILVFIDVDECDRVLEGRFDSDGLSEIEDYGEIATTA